MSDKPIKIPGPDHPIKVAPNPNRIVVMLGGKVIADTRQAMTLREAHFPPVHYIPREDVDMGALEPSEHKSDCPYKGEASYFHIPAGREWSQNAVWTYEQPYDAVPEIKGRLAFFADSVDSIDELSA